MSDRKSQKKKKSNGSGPATSAGSSSGQSQISSFFGAKPSSPQQMAKFKQQAQAAQAQPQAAPASFLSTLSSPRTTAQKADRSPKMSQKKAAAAASATDLSADSDVDMEAEERKVAPPPPPSRSAASSVTSPSARQRVIKDPTGEREHKSAKRPASITDLALSLSSSESEEDDIEEVAAPSKKSPASAPHKKRRTALSASLKPDDGARASSAAAAATHTPALPVPVEKNEEEEDSEEEDLVAKFISDQRAKAQGKEGESTTKNGQKKGEKQKEESKHDGAATSHKKVRKSPAAASSAASTSRSPAAAASLDLLSPPPARAASKLAAAKIAASSSSAPPSFSSKPALKPLVLQAPDSGPSPQQSLSNLLLSREYFDLTGPSFLIKVNNLYTLLEHPHTPWTLGLLVQLYAQVTASWMQANAAPSKAAQPSRAADMDEDMLFPSEDEELDAQVIIPFTVGDAPYFAELLILLTRRIQEYMHQAASAAEREKSRSRSPLPSSSSSSSSSSPPPYLFPDAMFQRILSTLNLFISHFSTPEFWGSEFALPAAGTGGRPVPFLAYREVFEACLSCVQLVLPSLLRQAALTEVERIREWLMRIVAAEIRSAEERLDRCKPKEKQEVDLTDSPKATSKEEDKEPDTPALVRSSMPCCKQCSYCSASRSPRSRTLPPYPFLSAPAESALHVLIGSFLLQGLDKDTAHMFSNLLKQFFPTTPSAAASSSDDGAASSSGDAEQPPPHRSLLTFLAHIQPPLFRAHAIAIAMVALFDKATINSTLFAQGVTAASSPSSSTSASLRRSSSGGSGSGRAPSRSSSSASSSGAFGTTSSGGLPPFTHPSLHTTRDRLSHSLLHLLHSQFTFFGDFLGSIHSLYQSVRANESRRVGSLSKKIIYAGEDAAWKLPVSSSSSSRKAKTAALPPTLKNMFAQQNLQSAKAAAAQQGGEEETEKKRVPTQEEHCEAAREKVRAASRVISARFHRMQLQYTDLLALLVSTLSEQMHQHMDVHHPQVKEEKTTVLASPPASSSTDEVTSSTHSNVGALPTVKEEEEKEGQEEKKKEQGEVAEEDICIPDSQPMSDEEHTPKAEAETSSSPTPTASSSRISPSKRARNKAPILPLLCDCTLTATPSSLSSSSSSSATSSACDDLRHSFSRVHEQLHSLQASIVRVLPKL